MIATKPVTVADLDLLELDIQDYEILDGVLWERKTLGRIHGRVGFDLAWDIGAFVKSGRLGELYTSDTNFIITKDPLSVLRPDIAFVRADRLRPEDLDTGYYDMVPDLVVEVLSPRNRSADIARKIERYQGAGVPLIWVVDPRTRTVAVHALGQDPTLLIDTDVLDGGAVLVGFSVPIHEIFR